MAVTSTRRRTATIHAHRDPLLLGAVVLGAAWGTAIRALLWGAVVTGAGRVRVGLVVAPYGVLPAVVVLGAEQ